MLWITWPICAVLVVAIYLWLGKATTRNRGGDDYAGSVFGILIDDRGRYSLTRLQLSLWTLVVLSLTAGVFAAKAGTRGVDPLSFSIPAQVLGLLGISVGSAAIATGVKAHKNRTRPMFVAASMPGEARLAQMLMVEEGPQADKIVDVAKLQNFLITVFLAGAYVALAVHAYAGWGPGTPITSPADIAALPAFSGSFLILLTISHAGYLGAKMPNRGSDLQTETPDMPLVRVNAKQAVERKRAQAPTGKSAAAAMVEKVRDEEFRAAMQTANTSREANGGGLAGQAPPQQAVIDHPASGLSEGG
jgi:hypothetical protein